MAKFEIEAKWSNGHFQVSPDSSLPIDEGRCFMLFGSSKEIIPVTFSGGLLTPSGGTLDLTTGTTYQICISKSAQELEDAPVY